jgi:hypothetical protein
LAFVQLIEAALHGAAVKEPLLAAVVADEPETPVSNEPLDRAACHARRSLGAKCPGANYQFSFRHDASKTRRKQNATPKLSQPANQSDTALY